MMRIFSWPVSGRILAQAPFPGVIGKTLADSELFFEQPPHPGEDAPNVVVAPRWPGNDSGCTRGHSAMSETTRLGGIRP